MSESKHSMITRSKQMDTPDPPPPTPEDDVDEKGNLKGFIEYG